MALTIYTTVQCSGEELYKHITFALQLNWFIPPSIKCCSRSILTYFAHDSNETCLTKAASGSGVDVYASSIVLTSRICTWIAASWRAGKAARICDFSKIGRSSEKSQLIRYLKIVE